MLHNTAIHEQHKDGPASWEKHTCKESHAECRSLILCTHFTRFQRHKKGQKKKKIERGEGNQRRRCRRRRSCSQQRGERRPRLEPPAAARRLSQPVEAWPSCAAPLPARSASEIGPAAAAYDTAPHTASTQLMALSSPSHHHLCIHPTKPSLLCT